MQITLANKIFSDKKVGKKLIIFHEGGVGYPFAENFAKINQLTQETKTVVPELTQETENGMPELAQETKIALFELAQGAKKAPVELAQET